MPRRRVLSAEIAHETNSFSILPTTLESYRARLYYEGADIAAAMGGGACEIAAHLDQYDIAAKAALSGLSPRNARASASATACCGCRSASRTSRTSPMISCAAWRRCDPAIIPSYGEMGSYHRRLVLFGLFQHVLGFIPACTDRYSFHRDYFGVRQGALCAVVPHTSSKAQRGIRAKEPGLRWHETGHRVRSDACPMPRHRAAHRACPNGRFDAMKWVPIRASWYKLTPWRAQQDW